MKEQISFGPESDKSIKEYEKNASKIASKYNSFFENLLKTGLISKEDVIRVDAEIENKLRDKVKKYELENESGINTTNDFENSSRKDKIKQMSDSDLIFDRKTKKVISSYDSDNPHVDTLKGKIKGQDVLIKKHWRGDPHSVMNYSKYEGLLNNKDLPQEEGKKLFEKYIRLQEERVKEIEDLLKYRIASIEGEKEKKKKESEFENIKEELEKLK